MAEVENSQQSAAEEAMLASSAAPPSPTPSLISALASHRDIVILYGSQSGSAAELASRLSLDAFQRGFRPPLVLSLDSFPLHRLPSTPLLLIVVSTQGNADPPDNAKLFYRSLLRRSLPPSFLSSLHFSVFGLGDSSYPTYNAIARRVYQRMLDLGAVSVCRRGLGDDQDEFGYEEGWEAWTGELWTSMKQRLQWMRDTNDDDIDRSLRPPPPFAVTMEERKEEEQEAAEAAKSSPWVRVTASLPLPSPASSPMVLPPISLPPFGPTQPYPAQLTHNLRLTPLSHFQDVRHLRFSLPPSHPPFQPGDVIDIFPRNNPAVAATFLSTLSLSPPTLISLTPTPTASSTTHLPSHCTLQELCEVHLDIAGTPKRSFFAFLALHATDALQREKLLDFCTKEGQAELWRYCQKERRTYTEVLQDFASARPPLDELIAHIPRLAPRSFSIASSALLHPGQVDVTAALLTFTTPWKRKRMGVCSTFLSLLPQSHGTDSLPSVVYVPVVVRSGGFVLPKFIGWGGPPVLMIGPGTGVAPFRAMCQHKQALLSSPPPSASHSSSSTFSPYLLVFGNRNRAADFLYEEEWARWEEDGVLTWPVVTAWSRDQEDKVYVQDRLVEEGVRSAVFEFLVRQRGVLVLAGSSGAMPREVRRAIVRVLQMEGGMDEADAQAYVRGMEKERRYIQETW